MPKIKTISGVYDGTDYTISRTNSILVVSPTLDYLWVGDQALDYTTLVPAFDVSNVAHDALGGTRNSFPVSRGVYNTKSTAFHPMVSGYDNLVAYGENMSEWSSLGHYHNLDKTESISQGDLHKVTDGNGEDVHILTASSGSALNALIAYDGKTSAPTNTASLNVGEYEFRAETNASLTVYNASQASDLRQFTILHIDTANKTVFLRGAGKRTHRVYRDYSFSTAQYTVHNLRLANLWKATYQTTSEDGAVTISTPVKVPLGYGGQLHYGDSNPLFYAGENNAGLPCFLMMIENNSQWPMDLAGFNHGTLYTPSNYSKTNKGQVLFYTYDPATSALTQVADLRGSEGFVGDVNQTTDDMTAFLSNYTPTHFEPSPIAGEDNICYAYTPIFDSATETLKFLLLTWDKANDTLNAEVCAPTMAGADVISDYVTYINASDDTNQLTRLNLVMTESGGSYYLSVFYSHTVGTNLSANNLPTNRLITSFSIDATDFSSLTYHSSSSFPVLGWVSQNSERTRLLAILDGEASVYDWNAEGWVKSATESGNFLSLTHDDQGRYWGVSVSSSDVPNLPDHGAFLTGSYKNFSMSLHLISASLPSLVSCVWQDSGNFTFTGASFTKNIVLNAYDENGNREAKSVALVLSGSATFTTNGTKNLTTLTSAAQDTLVSVTISSAGQVSVSASFAL